MGLSAAQVDVLNGLREALGAVGGMAVGNGADIVVVVGHGGEDEVHAAAQVRELAQRLVACGKPQCRYLIFVCFGAREGHLGHAVLEELRRSGTRQGSRVHATATTVDGWPKVRVPRSKRVWADWRTISRQLGDGVVV